MSAIAQKINILVDTREQRPYTFEVFPNVQTISIALKSGDYSIQGYEDRIVIERKALTDFLSSITRGRQRLENELTRLQPVQYKFIVVESEFTQLMEYASIHTQISLNSILGTVADWSMEYGVQFFFLGSRKLCENLCYRLFKRFLDIERGTK